MTTTKRKVMPTYTTEFILDGRTSGRVIYQGPSKGLAGKAAADALGYRDIRSAYDYTSTTKDGNEGVFYCRRKEAHREDYDVAVITKRA